MQIKRGSEKYKIEFKLYKNEGTTIFHYLRHFYLKNAATSNFHIKDANVTTLALFSEIKILHKTSYLLLQSLNQLSNRSRFSYKCTLHNYTM